MAFKPKHLPKKYNISDVAPFRVEGWESDGVDHVLAMVLRPRSGGKRGFDWEDPDNDSVAWLLTRDRTSGAMRFGHGAFKGWETFSAPREAVAKAISRIGPATPLHDALFGLSGAPPKLAPIVVDMLVSGSPQYQGRRREAEIFVAAQRGPVFPAIPEGLDRAAELGYADGSYGRLMPNLPGLSGVDLKEIPPGLHDFLHWVGGYIAEDEIAGLFNERLAAAMAPVRQAFDTALTALVGHINWSREAYAFYAAPGALGERRRQAAWLYPAFAPLIANHAVLAGLIDAGRPFEQDLAGILTELCHSPGQPPISLPLLRRLRHLAGEIPFAELLQVVGNAARMPVDWLPDSREEWEGFRDTLEDLHAFATQNGLALADLLRSHAGQYRRFQAENQRPDPASSVTLDELLGFAHDTACSLDTTLLEPLARSILMDDDDCAAFFRPGNRATRGLAHRILYSGKTVAGVLRLSSQWHNGYDGFETSLPPSKANPTWPPLLKEAFMARNGLVVVPLTSNHQLRDEGSKKADQRGVPGLNHCVGGYGRECYAGETHILSVRRMRPDGLWERLSTVEVEFLDDGSAHVIQHQGLANAEPPLGAQRAVEDLLEALDLDPALVNPEAREKRDPEKFDAEYDWSDPANLEQAFAAWVPYLPRSVAAAGVDGLRDMVAAALTSGATPEPDDTDPGLSP